MWIGSKGTEDLPEVCWLVKRWLREMGFFNPCMPSPGGHHCERSCPQDNSHLAPLPPAAAPHNFCKCSSASWLVQPPLHSKARGFCLSWALPATCEPCWGSVNQHIRKPLLGEIGIYRSKQDRGGGAGSCHSPASVVPRPSALQWGGSHLIALQIPFWKWDIQSQMLKRQLPLLLEPPPLLLPPHKNPRRYSTYKLFL